MPPGRGFAAAAATAILLASSIGSPVQGAGFSIFEQGARAAGMAGAYTAQADDPSAMFHNVGGLALFRERRFAAGLSLTRLGESRFRGLLPLPGPTQTGEQRDRFLPVPHFYWVEPLARRWTFGLAVNSPFGLVTEWDDPDRWSGRFISQRAEIETLDLNPNAGFRLGERVGLGFGLLLRGSRVELQRREDGINAFTLTGTDIAETRLESDLDIGFGFTVGLVQRVSDRLSWGINYRSPVKVDYSGDTTIRQIPTGNAMFDAEVARNLPSGKPTVETEIEFPDQLFLGGAVAASQRITVELDLIRHGWSSFDRVELRFPDGELEDEVLRQDWDDVFAIRLGVSWDVSQRAQWRFGYFYDESPQPAETLGPLLSDANRNGVSIGYGLAGATVRSDVYAMYVRFEDRATMVNRDNFSGAYEGEVLLAGATFGW